MRRRAQLPAVRSCLPAPLKGVLRSAGLLVMFAALVPSARGATLQTGVEPIHQLGGATTALAHGQGVIWSVIGPRVVAWDATGSSRLGASPPMPEIPRALAVARSQLYVVADDPRAERVAQLRILDPRDPTSPALLGSLALGESLRVGDLVSDGAFVHVLTERGLWTVDVKQPRAPRLLRRMPLPASSEAADDLPWLDERPGKLARAGDLLLCAGPGGLHIVDLADPSHPRLLSHRPDRQARDVAIHGPRAYVLGADRSVSVLSLVDPARPQLRARIELPGPAGDTSSPALPDAPLAMAVDEQGHDLAVLDRAGRSLLLFDLADADEPQLRASRPLSPARSRLGGLLWLDRTDGGLGVAEGSGARLMVASALGGLALVDPVDPGAPLERPTKDMVPPLGHVAAAGTRVVAAAGTRGVILLERAPHGASRGASGLDRAREPWRVSDVVSVVTHAGVHADVRRVAASADGREAFAWTAAHGLAVLSLDPRPGAPARGLDWLPYVPAPSPGAAMQVVAGHLYLIDREGVLRVIDATLPRRPVQRAALPELDAIDFAVQGHRLAVLGGGTRAPRLSVLDLSDPAQPAPMGTVVLPEAFRHIAFDGRHAFLLDERAGLAVYDLSEPARPRLMRRNLRFAAGAARAEDGRLLVLGPREMSVYDIATAAHPRPRPEEGVALPDGWVGGARGARSLTLLDSRVLVAREAAGLYDLPAPARPDAPPAPPERVWQPRRLYLPAVYRGPSGPMKPPREAPPPIERSGPRCELALSLLLDGSTAVQSQTGRVDDVVAGIDDRLAGAASAVGVAVRINVLRFDRQAEVLGTGIAPGGALPRRGDFAPAPRAGVRIDLAFVAARWVADLGQTESIQRSEARIEPGRHAVLIAATPPLRADDPDRLARSRAEREADRMRVDGTVIHAVALGAGGDLSFLHRLSGDVGRIHRPPAGGEHETGEAIASALLADAARCGDRVVAEGRDAGRPVVSGR